VASLGEQELSWSGLGEQSDQVAQWLSESGVLPGDRIALLLDRSLEAVVGIFGVLKAGGVYVPLDPMSPPQRNRALITDCAARIVLSSDRWMRRIGGLEQALAVQGNSAILNLSDLSDLSVPGAPLGDPGQAEDLAAILYTSGSTGVPKGVMLSHRAILAFVEWAVEHLGLGPDDRVSGVSPLQFDLSTLEIFGAMAAGGRACIAPPGASAFPESLAAFLAAEQISCWYSVPSVLMRLAEAELGPHDLSALREIPFAGEVFPPLVLRALMERLPGARFHNFFGPTESNVCVACSLSEAPVDETPIGRAASGARIQIRDMAGERVEAGQRGELWVAGPSLMSGYWGDPAGTDAVLVWKDQDRWLRTGDEVSEVEGQLWFHGRLDSMLKIGGFRLHPEAIEQVLCSHQGVRAARVAKLGEDLCAWVEAPGMEARDLDRLCRSRLAPYMIPTRIEIVDTLPRTDRGKLVR
jgi:amino acid adenylation domain-containing protein